MNRTTTNMYPKPLLFSDYALLLPNNINPSDNQFAGATDDWYVLYNEAWNRDLHCYGESMHSAFKQWILNSLDAECIQDIQYSVTLKAFTFRALSF